MLPVRNTIYAETEASKIYSFKNETPGLVESPQSPITSPSYQKVSPTVIQWQSKCMKDNYTSASNRSYRSIPPAMIDPDSHEELDKLQNSIHYAFNRSTRSQIHAYDPKVVKKHKRPPNNKIFLNKNMNAMDIDYHGGDGGDGGRGICAFIRLKSIF